MKGLGKNVEEKVLELQAKIRELRCGSEKIDDDVISAIANKLVVNRTNNDVQIIIGRIMENPQPIIDILLDYIKCKTEFNESVGEAK